MAKASKQENETKKKTGAKGAGASATKTASKSKGDTYDASSITVLEGLEPVRKRPGMYIGTTGPDGLHHLIWEIFDNARDEAMGGFADDIEITLLPNNRIRVVDNGRGIPVDKHPHTKVSALETIMTTLHAGGKFGGEASGYKVSGGLHGVGASVVNALSVYARVEVHKDGSKYEQEYKIGKALAPVKKIGSTDHNGTIVTFEADASIFQEIKYEWSRVVSHVRQQAYLVKDTRISVVDARGLDKVADKDAVYIRELGLEVPSMTFYFEGGLRSLIAFYNQHQTLVHKNIFYTEKEQDNIVVELALQYTDDTSPRLTASSQTISIHPKEERM